jgi:soluble lytic murein transglycosylase-like protein
MDPMRRRSNNDIIQRIIIAIMITIGLLLIAFDANAEIIKNPVYEQIVQNRPDISRSYALELSRLIIKHSEAYDVPVNYMTAILSVESDYRLYAVNGASNDYGISQINEWNVKAYKMSKQRLLTDLDYSVEMGAKIFRYFVKRYRRQGIERAVMGYNCGTSPKCVKIRRVQSYLRKVQKRL